MFKRYPELETPDWMRRKYEEELLTIAEMATELGCPALTIIRAMQRHGVVGRTPQETAALRGKKKQSGFSELRDADWLRSKYEGEKLSPPQIGALVGCSGANVRKALVSHGIARRAPGGVKGHVDSRRIGQLYDREWLRREYVENRRTAEEIAEELACSPWSVQSRVSDEGFKRRRRLPGREEPIGEVPEKWKRKGGYIFAYVPDHPLADPKGYCPLHRLVAERELGRMLTAREVVHHLNVKRNDNRPENLLVFRNNAAHMAFHHNPPAWVPRCECCGKPNPEKLEGRPEGVPLYYEN